MVGCRWHVRFGYVGQVHYVKVTSWVMFIFFGKKTLFLSVDDQRGKKYMHMAADVQPADTQNTSYGNFHAVM